ncbi:hypothetical protein [Halopseudomonas laoshanensis]|uniref:hypothetical protein n=1 Tax=Halopseudomonas laoshanensis TaxID=2268758 RepID=UPI0011ECAF47|nr:hypothetical protein [Halopseudomonas laoshanensis]
MKGRDRDDDLPSFRATDDHDPLSDRDQPSPAVSPRAETIHTPLRPEPSSQGNGALWALCAALTLALIGFGYWSHQQQTQLRQQLVATQNSFARISEDAVGRIQDITGKVSATESSRSEAEQARAAQLEQLEKQVAELTDQVQTQTSRLDTAATSERDLLARLAAQEELVQAGAEQLTEQQEQLVEQEELLEAIEQRSSENLAAVEELEQMLTALNGEAGQLTQLEQQLERQAARTSSLESKLEILARERQSVNLDQELLVLRSEIDQRLSSTQDALESIDSFRVQVNRNINTLRTQMSNLQQQVSAP